MVKLPRVKMKPVQTKTEKFVINESPLGLNQAALDQEDQFTKSLLNVAYPDRKENPEKNQVSRFGTRISRFWFRMESAKEETERRKKDFKPKELEHFDAEIEARLKNFVGEFPPELRKNLTTIREFFLKEVAPYTVAASAGTGQAKAVVERMLKTEVDSSLLGRFENMVNRAATIKLGIFVLNYFNLPIEHLSSMFGAPKGQQSDSELNKVIKLLTDMQTEMKQEKLERQQKIGLQNASRRTRSSRS
jgi:hypothetical protein